MNLGVNNLFSFFDCMLIRHAAKLRSVACRSVLVQYKLRCIGANHIPRDQYMTGIFEALYPYKGAGDASHPGTQNRIFFMLWSINPPSS